MSSLGLTDVTKPSSAESGVALSSLAEMTGFPVDYIKRELLLTADSDLSVDELRMRVMAYLEKNF